MDPQDPRTEEFKKDWGDYIELHDDTKKVHSRLGWIIGLSLLIITFIFFRVDYGDFAPVARFMGYEEYSEEYYPEDEYIPPIEEDQGGVEETAPPSGGDTGDDTSGGDTGDDTSGGDTGDDTSGEDTGDDSYPGDDDTVSDKYPCPEPCVGSGCDNCVGQYMGCVKYFGVTELRGKKYCFRSDGIGSGYRCENVAGNSACEVSEWSPGLPKKYTTYDNIHFGPGSCCYGTRVPEGMRCCGFAGEVGEPCAGLICPVDMIQTDMGEVDHSRCCVHPSTNNQFCCVPPFHPREKTQCHYEHIILGNTSNWSGGCTPTGQGECVECISWVSGYGDDLCSYVWNGTKTRCHGFTCDTPGYFWCGRGDCDTTYCPLSGTCADTNRNMYFDEGKSDGCCTNPKPVAIDTDSCPFRGDVQSCVSDCQPGDSTCFGNCRQTACIDNCNSYMWGTEKERCIERCDDCDYRGVADTCFECGCWNGESGKYTLGDCAMPTAKGSCINTINTSCCNGKCYNPEEYKCCRHPDGSLEPFLCEILDPDDPPICCDRNQDGKSDTCYCVDPKVRNESMWWLNHLMQPPPISLGKDYHLKNIGFGSDGYFVSMAEFIVATQAGVELVTGGLNGCSALAGQDKDSPVHFLTHLAEFNVNEKKLEVNLRKLYLDYGSMTIDIYLSPDHVVPPPSVRDKSTLKCVIECAGHTVGKIKQFRMYEHPSMIHIDGAHPGVSWVAGTSPCCVCPVLV